MYMLLNDILFEADNSAVDSTWITNLKYGYPWNLKICYMKTNTGARYTVHNISIQTFTKWKKAESKGAFFHKFIKNSHLVTR